MTTNIEIILEMLKIDLGISTSAFDERLSQYIDYAIGEIEREGCALDDSKTEDCTLIAMYAAWLWRNRDTGAGMPRMIRYALNNKVFAQKLQGEE